MEQIVLIVEDEEMIREAVSSYLKRQGCQVFSCERGKEALEIFDRESITFVILDLMLPDISGEEICQILRKKSSVPILMLTAKSQEADMLYGLQIGADDYMMKPFSLKVLYARMQVILRRAGQDAYALADTYSWNQGDLRVNFSQRQVLKQGKEVKLTSSEWKILTALIRYPQKAYTRDELLDLVFGTDFDGYDRVIDTHIKNLRHKVETDSRNPIYIKTVHGLGYRFGGEQK